MLINADRSQVAVVHAGDLPWITSPEQGVERRMLERVGDEVALASTIVRYRPGAHFAVHQHDFGEELLVLQGIFSDEHGHYPAGTYVRNPPGSMHSPYSAKGCVIFVKLRQMQLDETEYVRVASNDRVWQTNKDLGYKYASLYKNGRINVELWQVHSGTVIPEHLTPRGQELFVVEGSVVLHTEQHQTLKKFSWLRDAREHQASISSNTGALLWVKQGHLS